MRPISFICLTVTAALFCGCLAEGSLPSEVDSNTADMGEPSLDLSDPRDMYTQRPDFEGMDLEAIDSTNVDANTNDMFSDVANEDFGQSDSGADMASCAPLSLCSDVCIDTLTNVEHCGACDDPCVAPMNAMVDSCSGGACVYACIDDHYDVDGDLQAPDSNGCEDDCLPTAEEICDGVDNTCDGTIDEGCPTDVSFSNFRDGFRYGGSGGSFFRTSCPMGMVLVGISGREASKIDRIQGVCKTLQLFEDTSVTPYEYTAESSGSSRTLPAQGGSGGSFSSAHCPQGEVVIGIYGRADNEIDALTLRCGRIDLEDSGSGFTVQRIQTVNRVFGGGSGGSSFSYTCPGRKVVTGLFGRDGNRIDALGVRCTDVDVSLRSP